MSKCKCSIEPPVQRAGRASTACGKDCLRGLTPPKHGNPPTPHRPASAISSYFFLVLPYATSHTL
jgi:hypothetical protein